MKLVAGNWKMNLSLSEGISLAKGVKEQLASTDLDVKVVLGVPYTHLAAVVQAVDGEVAVSAQDCSAHEKGAYTGEVSAEMIASTGAEYIILGHSERRSYHGEESALLVEKLNQALEHGLKVIFCCGESLEERQSAQHFEVVGTQLTEALFHLDEATFKDVVIAYEPVWAIGTGETATSAQAQEMHAFIRQLLSKQYGEERAAGTAILYGGSCKPSNAQELFAQEDVDGGLIGGASLKADDFVQIIHSY
jgi:triosephosphate isomerase (TIM)